MYELIDPGVSPDSDNVTGLTLEQILAMTTEPSRLRLGLANPRNLTAGFESSAAAAGTISRR